MTRPDIQVIQKDKTIIVWSADNFFSFSKNGTGRIKAFCNVDFSSDALADVILSGIVSIVSYDKGNFVLSPKFGYDILKMEDVIISIFEKYNL